MKLMKKIKPYLQKKFFYFYFVLSKILSYWIIILILILILSVLTVFLLFVFEKNNTNNNNNNNFNTNMVSNNSKNSKIMVLYFLNLSAKNNNLNNFFNSKIIIDNFSDTSVTYSNNRYYFLINGYFISNYDNNILIKTKNTVSIEKNISYSFFSDTFTDKNLNNFLTNNLNSSDFWFFKDKEKIIPNHYINAKNAEKIAFLYSKINYYGGYDAFNSYHKINNFIIQYDEKTTDVFKFFCYFQYDNGSTNRDYSHGAFSFSIPKNGNWKYNNNLISTKIIKPFAISKFSNNVNFDINNNHNSEIKINFGNNLFVMYRSYISNVFQNKTINFSYIGFSAFLNSNFSCEILPYNNNGSNISALTINTKSLNEPNFSSSINDNLLADNIGNIYDGDQNESGNDKIIFFPQKVRKNKCLVSIFNYYKNNHIQHITKKIGGHNYNFGYAFFKDTKTIESFANSNIDPDNYIIIMPIFVMSDSSNLNNNQTYIFYNNEFSINPANDGKSEFSFAW